MSFNAHALNASPTRSLALSSAYAPSPAHALEGGPHAHALAPPSLHASQQSNLVLRSLYPQSGGGGGNNSAFESHEAPVYRSVAMESGLGLGLGGAQPFDPLARFGDAPYASATYPAKELSLNPKHAYNNSAHFGGATTTQQADYKATLKFTPSQVQPPPALYQELKANPLPTPVVQAAATPAPAGSASAMPPQSPQWLEPNSHFFCSCQPPTTPHLLYDTVHATLQSLHESGASSEGGVQGTICALDCETTPTRFKIVCTAYQSHSGLSTPFIVRIFTHNAAKHEYCVEFQRRQGDVCAFYELFRTARTRIQAAHPHHSAPELQHAASADSLNLASLDISLPQPVLRSWSAPALPQEEFSGSFSKDHICETVRSLLQMCASPCVDIKLQGVLALAELSCSPSFGSAIQKCKPAVNMTEILVAEGCFDFFLECLPLEHMDIHRASLTALANLSEQQPELCSRAVSNEKCIRAMHRLATSSTHQVVRECARFLSTCASKLGTSLVDKLPKAHQPTFQQTVLRLMQHKDAHARKHAANIKQCCMQMEQQQQQQQQQQAEKLPALVNAQ